MNDEPIDPRIRDGVGEGWLDVWIVGPGEIALLLNAGLGIEATAYRPPPEERGTLIAIVELNGSAWAWTVLKHVPECYSAGLWLADCDSGVLVRSVEIFDYARHGWIQAGDTFVDAGRLVEAVDGFAYSARVG